MGEASDKHDEQCANLKKAAAICEQRGQGLVDSVIALQATITEQKLLDRKIRHTQGMALKREVERVGTLRATITELTAENELSVLAMTRACECVKTLQTKVDTWETSYYQQGGSVLKLQAKVEELEQEKTTLIKLGQEDSRYQNLLSETQSLRAKVEALTNEP